MASTIIRVDFNPIVVANGLIAVPSTGPGYPRRNTDAAQGLNEQDREARAARAAVLQDCFWAHDLRRAVAQKLQLQGWAQMAEHGGRRLTDG